ncbi:hypothetical protein [Streptomyces sp. RKAG337]|uniref:hypothetical protein n=1 Tax=Streptomyces sp. RKAG337 TaxID=2893404 RepID=UPI0020333AE5|nr:hypothetical protein [Streptomyces sp. RKAG337]MCM2424951.1 hypothetical protein [Streptomyces sp. RKAG337]
MKSLRARYGASPLHLLLVLCSFALTAYAGTRLLKGDTLRIAIWFVGAALIHDLVLLPLYTLTDRAAQALVGSRGGAGKHDRPPTTWINYLRVPTFVALLLLITWYPLILNKVPGYHAATSLPSDVFLGRWLLITAALFAASALCLITSMRRHRTPRPQPRTRTKGTGGPSDPAPSAGPGHQAPPEQQAPDNDA